MRELHRSPHFVITLDDEHLLLRRTRTDVAFESIAEIELVHDMMMKASEPLGHTRLVLLADARQAPARNDPVFEQIVNRYSPRLFRGFRRIAVLVRTEAGRLQVTRLLRDNGVSARVFLDEAAAVAYLLESPPGSAPALPDGRGARHGRRF